MHNIATSVHVCTLYVGYMYVLHVHVQYTVYLLMDFINTAITYRIMDA